MPVIKEMSVDI